MKRLFVVLFSPVFIFCGLSDAFAETAFEVRVKGTGRANFATVGGEGSFDLSINHPDRGPFKGGFQGDRHKYIDYGTEVRCMKEKKPLPPETKYEKCVVDFHSNKLKLHETVFLLPWFHHYGLYDHAKVEKNVDWWKTIYPLSPDREYVLRFVPDPRNARTLFYLDGSLFAKLDGVKQVTDAKSDGRFPLAILSKAKVEVRTEGFEELSPIPNRAHRLLAKDAKLSLKPGPQVIKGIPMTVWRPEESIDQGRHYHTSNHRELTSDPMHNRSPWKCGPEYSEWRVPGKSWLNAWVLCADLPEEGKRPVVGVNFARFGGGCSWTTIDQEKVDIRSEVKGQRSEVGTLTYKNAAGKPVTSPLYLVKVPLRIDVIGARAKNAFALDFEFCGTGTANWQNDGKRSSVQIFGCSLAEAPFSFKVNNPVRGNIFEQGKDEQRSHLDVLAHRDGVKGTLEIDIFGPDHRTIRKGVRKFEIAKRGEKFPIDVNLSGFDVGWYGMGMKFFDASGDLVTSHDAAFTVLAPDDREAGYESPYAAWPHSNGYHGSNPDPMGTRTMMLKAGYRNSWEPPVKSEEEGRPWKIGLNTLGYKCCQPGNPAKSRAEFDRRLDAQVEKIREQIKLFPHAQVIQLLHEQGGRDIAAELIGKKKPVRGEYRGWDFDAPVPKDWWQAGYWEVFYCTEWAKRLRREFPDRKIMIGNGSSSSEKIAALVSKGFDLSLVDQLGIESKGFQTPPEMAANREAPGMLWALRETGRVFGYTNFTLNACNEYVFRPERPNHVAADRTPQQMMQVTDYTLRDYLISLAHGCTIISTGHLEDAADAYYDTNWGAGGQCTAYPYSYPKRMFTALAVLTRVLDCPKYRRRLPTGEISTYALEFVRMRKVKDVAYAFWTPEFPVVLEVTFPEGTAVTRYEAFGRAHPVKGNVVRLVAGSTPCYLVASKGARSAKVVEHVGMKPLKDLKPAFLPSPANVSFSWKPALYDAPGPGTPGMRVAKFEKKAEPVCRETGFGGLALTLVPEGNCPRVIAEGTELVFKDGPVFKADETDAIGLWIKGNGSMSRFRMFFRSTTFNGGWPGMIHFTDRGNMNFDGWRYFEARLPATYAAGKRETKGETLKLTGMAIGTARTALDPIEMSPVENDVAIGPVYVIPKGRAQNRSAALAAGVEAVMKTVNDKDL